MSITNTFSFLSWGLFIIQMYSNNHIFWNITWTTMNDQPFEQRFLMTDTRNFVWGGGIVSPSDLASINIVCVCMFIYIHLCVLCINLCNCKIIWFLEVLPNYVDIICPCCVLLTNEEEVVWRSLPVILFYWGEDSHLYPAIHHPSYDSFISPCFLWFLDVAHPIMRIWNY